MTTDNSPDSLRRRGEEAAVERLLRILLPPGSSAEVQDRFRNLLKSGAPADRRIVVTRSAGEEILMTVQEAVERLVLEEYEKLPKT